MRIGEIAAAANVSTRTVDYYTSLGLITPAERTGGNFRLYRPEAVERIAAVRRLEASGAKLDEIVAALSGAAASPGTTGALAAAGATAGAAGLAAALRQVDTDLHELQHAAGDAGADAIGLLTAITARIHSLVTTALELTGGLPPTP